MKLQLQLSVQQKRDLRQLHQDMYESALIGVNRYAILRVYRTALRSIIRTNVSLDGVSEEHLRPRRRAADHEYSLEWALGTEPCRYAALLLQRYMIESHVPNFTHQKRRHNRERFYEDFIALLEESGHAWACS